MSTRTNRSTYNLPSLTTLWEQIKNASAPLAWCGAIMVLTSLITLVLSAIDPRLFQGVSVWHKPWKFQFSFALYCLTLALFMACFSSTRKHGFANKYIVLGTVLTGLFEVLYVSWQGGLGLASHYNISSPFYGAMYTAMGVFAVLLTSTSGVLGYQVLRDKTASFTTGLAMRHAIGWGLVITCVLGIATGAVLGARTLNGGHWVGGTANDALGMAVFNWSRDGGDLRVAHFFALHAMQILPALALLLLIAMPSMAQQSVKRLVWLLAVGFSAFCVFTLMQALRGIPFLA